MTSYLSLLKSIFHCCETSNYWNMRQICSQMSDQTDWLKIITILQILYQDIMWWDGVRDDGMIDHVVRWSEEWLHPLCWQRLPVKLWGQEHCVEELWGTWTQTPLFWHGLGWHTSLTLRDVWTETDDKDKVRLDRKKREKRGNISATFQ